jgi:hypothetical protein
LLAVLVPAGRAQRPDRRERSCSPWATRTPALRTTPSATPWPSSIDSAIDSGLYDTYIRTDSQWITKQPVPAPARNARNLDYFDAVFLFISGEGDWTDQQKKDFVSFVKTMGRVVVGAHTGNAAVLRVA